MYINAGETIVACIPRRTALWPANGHRWHWKKSMSFVAQSPVSIPVRESGNTEDIAPRS